MGLRMHFRYVQCSIEAKFSSTELSSYGNDLWKHWFHSFFIHSIPSKIPFLSPLAIFTFALRNKRTAFRSTFLLWAVVSLWYRYGRCVLLRIYSPVLLVCMLWRLVQIFKPRFTPISSTFWRKTVISISIYQLSIFISYSRINFDIKILELFQTPILKVIYYSWDF